jgi:hypothetical protein
MDDAAKRYVSEQGPACPLVNLALRGGGSPSGSAPYFTPPQAVILELPASIFEERAEQTIIGRVRHADWEPSRGRFNWLAASINGAYNDWQCERGPS